VEEGTIGSSTDFIDYIWFEIDVDGTWNILEERRRGRDKISLNCWGSDRDSTKFLNRW